MTITYDRDQFIKLADVKKKTAERYCDEHPKERYDCDDFIEVYHMEQTILHGGPVGHGLWDEHNTNFDRIVNIYSKNAYGE